MTADAQVAPVVSCLLLLVAISISEAALGAGNSIIGESGHLTEDVTSLARFALVNTFWLQDVSTRIYVRFLAGCRRRRLNQGLVVALDFCQC